MSGKTSIEWADRVWNPSVGCTRVSAGCDHCYAYELHDMRYAANLGCVKKFNLSLAGMTPRDALETGWFREQHPELVGAKGGLSRAKQYDRPFSQVQIMRDRLDEPSRVRKPSRWFVDSMSDLFHEDVPDGFIARVWMQMAQNPQHQFLILTKRPERMRDWVTRWMDVKADQDDEMRWRGREQARWIEENGITARPYVSSLPPMPRGPEAVREVYTSGRARLFADMLDDMVAEEGGKVPAGAAYPTYDWAEGVRWWPVRPLDNVWLGTSVEDQAAADLRIPELVETPAAIRFLSCEPLLGPLDLSEWLDPAEAGAETDFGWESRVALHWLIVGGESGKGARQFDVAWARDLIRQGANGGAQVFVKQLGAQPVGLDRECDVCKLGVKAPRSQHGLDCMGALKDKKGGTMSEWPEDLRVRAWPR